MILAVLIRRLALFFNSKQTTQTNLFFISFQVIFLKTFWLVLSPLPLSLSLITIYSPILQYASILSFCIWSWSRFVTSENVGWSNHREMLDNCYQQPIYVCFYVSVGAMSEMEMKQLTQMNWNINSDRNNDRIVISETLIIETTYNIKNSPLHKSALVFT